MGPQYTIWKCVQRFAELTTVKSATDIYIKSNFNLILQASCIITKPTFRHLSLKFLPQLYRICIFFSVQLLKVQPRI